MRSGVRLAVACACGVLLASPALAGRQGPKTPPRPAAAERPAATPPASSTRAFDALVAKAKAAREGNQLEAAIQLYEKAVKMDPTYADGYFYIGASNYELDRYRESRDAFRRVTELQPENGAGWVFKGLCEFRLANYDAALTELLRARKLGFGNNADLAATANYHIAILLTRNQEFEQALQILREFGQHGGDSPRAIEALGMAVLRMPMLPSELPGTRRDMVMLAGRASYFAASRLSMAAKKAFEELVLRYPETPNVHYAYGLFLTSEEPDAAIEQFKQELKVSSRHPWARVQIASEYIRRGDYEAARPWAHGAVEEAPDSFTARRAFGTVLLETGDVQGAIAEFESGVKLAPRSPQMRFALARAYRRAGRAADADREQAEFARLDRIARTENLGAQSVGGAEAEPDTNPRPRR